MTIHPALGVSSARSRTRILALARNARQPRSAVRIDHTLGSAIRRSSHIPVQALARRLVAGHAALRVRTARRRHARVARLVAHHRRHRRQRGTAAERIARLIRIAAADRTVIEHLAACIEAARTAARVHALLVHACLVGAALGADHALGPALGRHAHVAGQTGAGGLAVGTVALGVGAARRRMARLARSHRIQLGASTLAERIAGEAGRTRADRNVLNDLALGVVAARARARIAALAAHAGAIACTVGAAGALRAAALVRVALVLGQAGAFAVLAQGVGTARRRIAQVLGLRSLRWRRWFGRALGERIAHVAVVTGTDGNVSQDLALGLEAARAGTRIAALLVDAGLVAGAVGVQHALGTTVGRCTDVVL